MADEKKIINSAAVTGEPGTGYEGPESGIRGGCELCEYFVENEPGCKQKDMMEKSSRPRFANKHVAVHPQGCCAYRERKSGTGHGFGRAIVDLMRQK